MRQQFFTFYTNVKIAERYYCRYTNRAVLWNNIITGICLIASAATISTWALWNEIPMLWTILIASSQVLATLRPMLKSSIRLSAAKYLLPELCYLLDDLANTWDALEHTENISESDLIEITCNYRKRYTDIREKYASSELFPEKIHLWNLAQQDAITYFKTQYDIFEDQIINQT